MDDYRRRHSDQPGRIRWQVVAWVLGIAISALSTYNATANTMNARVAVLESRMNSLEYQIERMNNKLDRLLERVP